MTPTPAWYEADSDDSDRNATDDNTASTSDAPRGANLPAPDAPRGYADADVLKGRIAALEAASAENERLRAEVERLRVAENDAVAAYDAALSRAGRAEADADALLERALAAEADAAHLRAALARSQAPRALSDLVPDDLDADWGEQAPRAPAEQGRPTGRCTCWPSGDDDDDAGHDGDCDIWDGYPFPTTSVRPATADDEGVRRG